ncbi:MAG: Dabb family protein [Ignavibacteriales bacterium]|nr:Dabb family protein [Ignavibacteriales bacterium]
MAATGLLVTGCSTSEPGIETRFIHHVFFWLKEPVTPDIRKRGLEGALKELVTIETIIDSHLGIPAGTSREVIDASYTYSLLTTYKNKADQDIYQTHPKHLKFIEDCQDLWEKVVVYDSVSI